MSEQSVPPRSQSGGARLVIDLGALARNWLSLDAMSGDKVETSAVVKADAYGLGIDAVVPALVNAGCKTFFVATAEEGIQLRKISRSSRIFILNDIQCEAMETAHEYKLLPVLSSLQQIESWAVIGGNKTGCAIHVDTGMNRLGLSPGDVAALLKNAALLEKLNADFLISHLACADQPEHPKNLEQLHLFQTIAAKLPNMKYSLANSAGIFLGADYHFDLTRPGIALYGAKVVYNADNPMRAVVVAEARILQIRSAKKGETVSYGASHKLARDTTIAVVSVGYADGFHRAMSGNGVPSRQQNTNGGMGAIGDYLVPVLGRVTMDLTLFDVSDVPQSVLEHTEWIELFGNKISVDEAAQNCGTIGHELLTSLGKRYQRQYLQNA